MRKVITALSFVAMLVGCATRGSDFSTDLSWIKKGVTTKDEVKSLLREPYQVGSSSGQPTWTYGYYRFRLFGDSTTRELKFYWNRNGTVEDYSFTSSFPEDRQKALRAPENSPSAE